MVRALLCGRCLSDIYFEVVVAGVWVDVKVKDGRCRDLAFANLSSVSVWVDVKVKDGRCLFYAVRIPEFYLKRVLC